MNSTPEYIAGDPRVYGFSYTEGVVPNNVFDAGFGAAVPSSDSAPVVRAGSDGTVSQQAQQQAHQQTQQQVQTSRGAQQQYQQQHMQMLQPAQTAQPLYRPVPTAPLYPPADQGAQAQIPRTAASMPGMPALYPAVPNAGAFAGLDNRPQPPQPPPAHRGPPGYPWQGHPHMAYSKPLMGPDGTSPLHRGGPNLPAYATAPPQPMAYTGAVYPLNTPGVQEQNNGNPLFGGFAGVDLGALDLHLDSEVGDLSGRRADRRAQKAPKSRDARGGNGLWSYRQFANGSIQIVVSNNASLPVGKVITAQSHPRQWNAITAEIGTWQQFIKDRWAKRGQTALTLLEAGTKIAGKRKRRRGKGRRRRRKSAPPPDMPYMPPEEEEAGLPPWAVPAGILAVGGIVLALVLSGRRKKG